MPQDDANKSAAPVADWDLLGHALMCVRLKLRADEKDYDRAEQKDMDSIHRRELLGSIAGRLERGKATKALLKILIRETKQQPRRNV